MADCSALGATSDDGAFVQYTEQHDWPRQSTAQLAHGPAGVRKHLGASLLAVGGWLPSPPPRMTMACNA